MGLLQRTVSESSDDIDIRPLELGDLKRRLSESKEGSKSPIKSAEQQTDHADGNSGLFFSAVTGLKRKKGLTMSCDKSSLVKIAWQNAAIKALSLVDPWEKFHLGKYKTEKALRHRFHALKKCWVVDEVYIKMENKSFNHGAMRECFRTKKLSNFAKNDDWSRAHNYVAKRYMSSDIDRQTYFDDVRLQMDAKLWGEEFNRHNPPKKVDIFQMAILELIERKGSPLYHVEHFIEGKYVKYNSNSGFVMSEAMRMTPQAFSHFTFERSGHELIVVDIQGVGDLYTDPQIHTNAGSDYGDGNLGTRGMALFFHSHVCNSICMSLGLTQFDLSPSEIEECNGLTKAQKNAKTVIRGNVEHVIVPSEEERENIQECIRLRSISSGYLSAEERERIDSISSVDSADSFDDLNTEESVSESSQRRPSGGRRKRYDSTSDFGESTETKEINWKNFNDLMRKKSRPSHVLEEYEHQQMINSLQEGEVNEQEISVLGQIHLDLAKYHELNRFVDENQTYDREAAMFHLKYAAKCGTLSAILAMSQLHMGLPHDVLPDIELDEDSRDSSEAFKYLMMGAKCGDRASMIKIAKSYDTGIGLPCDKSVDWVEAVYWYEKAVSTVESDSSGGYDGAIDDPMYQLIARQAQLYVDGGNGLERDPNKSGEMFTYAADLASEAMKGKLASKYYIQAEEAWALVEE